MSDEWGAYQQQMSVGYTHTTVNHSQHFVDPNNGTCTNRIEAYRYAVKRRFKKMYVTVKQMAPSYLDKHMWLFCRRYVILLRGIQYSNATTSVLRPSAVGGQRMLWQSIVFVQTNRLFSQPPTYWTEDGKSSLLERQFTKLNRQMALSLILTLKLTLTLILPHSVVLCFFRALSHDLQTSQFCQVFSPFQYGNLTVKDGTLHWFTCVFCFFYCKITSSFQGYWQEERHYR